MYTHGKCKPLSRDRANTAGRNEPHPENALVAADLEPGARKNAWGVRLLETGHLSVEVSAAGLRNITSEVIDDLPKSVVSMTVDSGIREKCVITYTYNTTWECCMFAAIINRLVPL